MKLVTMVFLCLGMALIITPVNAELIQATYLLEINDSADDVSSGDDPGKDVVKVIMTTDGTKIDIAVLLKKEAGYYLEGHYAGDVVTLYLDTDNNQETGGEPFGFSHKTKGFEYSIEVGACIEYQQNTTVCAGKSDATTDYFFSTYALYQFNDASDRKKISEPFNWEDRGKKIVGNSVEVSLPYAKMNLTPGQTIRVSIKETDDRNNPYMPEALLTLK